ncbi:MAG: hypothetical protein IKK08_10795 [Clostridia bacterium]|nr:hypothetical protein [Clostridia bacterium]
MKKILSVLLALAMLLMPVLSLAEAAAMLAADYTTYTHADEQFSFMYPNSWTLLNAENVQSMLTLASETEDQELAQIIQTYVPQIEQSGMIMLLNETGNTNVNVIAQNVGMRATDEDLLSLAPTLVSQLSAALEGVEFVNEGVIINLGDKNGLIVEYNYTLSGTEMQGARVYVSGETDLYIFTYTCAAADEVSATSREFGFMLGTFTGK